MQGYQLTAAVLGIGLAAAILYLLRRDHLYLRDGLVWIAVALGSVALGLWPRLIDGIGVLLGVAYPPALLFLVAILVLLVRALLTDLAVTRMRRDLRRLNQALALADVEREAGRPATPAEGER
jgi:hypothetical protein